MTCQITKVMQLVKKKVIRKLTRGLGVPSLSMDLIAAPAQVLRPAQTLA